MEFRNCDSNADKVKLYDSVRNRLAKIHEDEPEASGPASVRGNPYKKFQMLLRDNQVISESKKTKGTNRGYSRVQERVKN